MADSKISDLPLSPFILDKDLMVVVTGHLEEGSFPHNVKVPLSYIRRYIVRLNLLTSPQSGIGSYYNSGTNILTLQHIPLTGNLMRYDYDKSFPHNQTISNTGSNHIRGNLIDIKFDKGSPAAVAMSNRNGPWFTNFDTKHLEEPYYSGIISVTGVNFRKENLIVIDIDNIWPHSGTVYNTGLNAVIGNNIDITFNQQHPASNKYGKTGPKYYSGIISTTGLNAYDGNLMRIDFDELWPYSGIVSQTGLNSIKGNLIDIQFSDNSEAADAMQNRSGPWYSGFDKNKNLGEKYHSGIISVTGINLITENLLTKEYENVWPYSGIIYNTGLNAVAGNNIHITFSQEHPANAIYGGAGPRYYSGVVSTTGLNSKSSHGIAYNINDNFPYDYSLLTIDKLGKINSNLILDNNTSGSIDLYDSNTSLYFGDLFTTYGNKTLDFFVSLLIANDKTSTITIPNVSNSAVKAFELSEAPEAPDWTPSLLSLEDNDLASISIESTNSTTLNNIISLNITGVTTFTGTNTQITLSNTNIIDYSRTNTDILEHYITSSININDFKCNNNLRIAAKYSLKNIRYRRSYQSNTLGSGYTTPPFYATNTRLTFNKPIILKTEHVYQPPSISWIVQPPNVVDADKNTAVVNITGIAVTDDYTKISYQWYESIDNISYTAIPGQTNSVLNTTINRDTYFKNLASTFNCAGSFSNTTLAKLIVEGIQCNVHPIDAIACSGSNVSFNGSATIIGAPTATINYQWYKNNNSITDGISSDGTYQGANTNNLTISNININNLRGSIFYLQASYLSPPVFSNIYISTEDSINTNINTENNEKIIGTVSSIETTFTCNTSGAKLWEAQIDIISSPVNFESFRNYAYFSTSASGYKFDGENREAAIIQYVWQKLPSGSANWNNISSTFPNPNTLTEDYPIVTGLLGGNIVPASSLFLDNISFTNNLDQYRAITNLGCLSITGSPAELIVREIRIIQQDFPDPGTYKFPNNITYNNIILPTGNSSLSLSVTADIFNPFVNNTGLFYQWQEANFISNTINIDNESWSDIENETSSVLNLSNLPENNTGLYKAYRLFIDDQTISNTTDDTSTLKRKVSNIFRIGNPAYISNTNNNIIYQEDNSWLVTREGSTNNTINPSQLFISGLRDLNNINYLNTIRSIATNTDTNTVYFAYLSMPPIISEISSTNFTTSIISGTIQTLTPETGIFISVTGNPADWSVRFVIPS